MRSRRDASRSVCSLMEQQLDWFSTYGTALKEVFRSILFSQLMRPHLAVFGFLIVVTFLGMQFTVLLMNKRDISWVEPAHLSTWSAKTLSMLARHILTSFALPCTLLDAWLWGSVLWVEERSASHQWTQQHDAQEDTRQWRWQHPCSTSKRVVQSYTPKPKQTCVVCARSPSGSGKAEQREKNGKKLVEQRKTKKGRPSK